MPERLTVIIPTRERCDTLRWALQTCVNQDFDEFDILVSDNASTDQTREVVESVSDSRVRYLNPGRRLGMSEHWEFALGHVQDGYVMFLGDDDGLMPRAAADITEVLAAEPADALIWPLSSYYWPEFFDQAIANCLSMPFPQHPRTIRLQSSHVLKDVGAFKAPHYLLPSPYWGVVHRAALDRASGSDNQVFHSRIPDVYSGVAVAAVTDSYLRSERIYSLSGVSRHSNGASQVTGHEEEDQPSKQEIFASESGLPFHPDLDLAGNVCVLVAESFLQAHDHVSRAVPKPDLTAMYRAALTHPDYLLNPTAAADTVAVLRRTAVRNGTSAILERELALEGRTRWARRSWAATKVLALGNPIVDCGPDRVSNIYEATVVADRILSRTSTPLTTAAIRLKGRATKLNRAWGSARTRMSRS